MTFRLSTKYYYTTENLARLREVTSGKICYRPALTFLKFRLTLTNSISNRLVNRSNYRCSYKLLRCLYTNVLRALFLPHTPNKLQPYVMYSFDKKDFLLAYAQYRAMRELDYVLTWRALQTNSLFNITTKKKRKRKKNYYTHRVFFIPQHKRLFFVWRWLSVIFKAANQKYTPRAASMLAPFENFLMAPAQNQILHNFKLQVYKIHLLRTV